MNKSEDMTVTLPIQEGIVCLTLHIHIYRASGRNIGKGDPFLGSGVMYKVSKKCTETLYLSHYSFHHCLPLCP